MIEIKRIISAALIAGAALVSVVAPSASAGERGGIAWSATKGNAETLITVYTETGCQYPATKVKVELFGEGMPAEGQVVLSPSTADFSATGPMMLPLSNAFVVYAQRNATPLVGKYTLKVQCIDRLGAKVIDEFVSTMKWSTPGDSLKNIEKATYTATNTAPASLVKTTSRDQGEGAVPVPQAQSSTSSPTEPSTTQPTGKAAASVPNSSGEPKASGEQASAEGANTSGGFPTLAVVLVAGAGALLLALPTVMQTKTQPSRGSKK
jgi:hypothetical protein